MDQVKRNFKQVCEAIGNGDVATVARKVRRSVAILREKNTLSTLESVVLRSVDKVAANLS